MPLEGAAHGCGAALKDADLRGANLSGAQLYHDSARATARLVLKAARKTARKVNNACPGV
ncbi:pentapeptide repeat-containing protein [Nonomuraea sp. NPDC050022]|uniref:pentapeptide repeat-containing protein n=1 Tax=unclassified Nonomuraea TaxID=2593643 RepID=UPI0033E74139